MARGENRRALAITLALTASFTVAEVFGGLLTGSLALLADAGHMLSDNPSQGVALFAAWLAGRPETPERSFGYKRAEILAALAKGVTLVAISIWIFVEAFSRLREPPEILGGPVLAIAALGLFVNAAGAIVLSSTTSTITKARPTARGSSRSARSRPALTSNPRTAQPRKASRGSKPIHRLAAAVVAV